jgi:hypothetical protein
MTRDEAEKHYRRLYMEKAGLWAIENVDAVAKYSERGGTAPPIGCVVSDWINAHVADAMLAWDEREWQRARWDETARERELQRLRDDTLVRMQQMAATMTEQEDQMRSLNAKLATVATAHALKDHHLEVVSRKANYLLQRVGELDDDGRFNPVPHPPLSETVRAEILPWLEDAWRALAIALEEAKP